MRQAYLDNVRGAVELSVIVYHIFYMFNSVGIIRNVDIPGIPQLDVVLYALYPWFMVCLFVIAGMSAKYALDKYAEKQFVRARVRRILIPSLAGVVLLGWPAGWVTTQYADLFGGNGDMVPLPIRFLIYCLCGIGPLWFLHQLFVATLVLLLVRKLDRRGRLYALCGRVNLPVLLLLGLTVWASAQVCNVPVMEVYRCGIYIWTFLLGYYVLTQRGVQQLLMRYAPVLLIAAAVVGCCYIWRYWGENYTLMHNLQSALTNAYAWLGTLAVIACGRRFWQKESHFTTYMRKNGFALYVLHYPLMTLLAYALDQLFALRGGMLYVALFVCECVCLPTLVMLVRRLPGVRRLVLGEA